MSIVGSDFHGNLDKVNRFLNYLPEEEHIFAGDILDSFTKSGEEQLQCLNTLIASDCLLIWGNHEQNYWKPRKPCSGFNWQWCDTFTKILYENKERFINAILVDDYIITHAGIGDEYVVFDDPELQVEELNTEHTSLYWVGYSRGGTHPQGGIFWFDHVRDGMLAIEYNQVFGHTASEFPIEYKGGHAEKTYHHVCINTWDNSERLWVFNTKTKMVEGVI